MLAAGASTRFGSPKQLAEIDGQPLARRAAEIARASACSSVRVVVGAHRDAVERTLAGSELQIVPNDDWEEGLASSIRAGIASLAAALPRPDAALLLLADQIAVSPALLDAVIGHFTSGEADLVACAYAGTEGPPALFARRFFPELGELRGDQGARRVLSAHADELALVDFPDGSRDVDSPADLPDRFREPS